MSELINFMSKIPGKQRFICLFLIKCSCCQETKEWFINLTVQCNEILFSVCGYMGRQYFHRCASVYPSVDNKGQEKSQNTICPPPPIFCLSSFGHTSCIVFLSVSLGPETMLSIGSRIVGGRRNMKYKAPPVTAIFLQERGALDPQLVSKPDLSWLNL